MRVYWLTHESTETPEELQLLADAGGKVDVLIVCRGEEKSFYTLAQGEVRFDYAWVPDVIIESYWAGFKDGKVVAETENIQGET